MNVFTVTSKVKEENVADAQAAIDKLFQELEQAQLPGVRYAATKLSDGVTFGAFLVVENSEDPRNDNPMRALPAYTELLEGLNQWRVEPVAAERMTVLGSYRMF